MPAKNTANIRYGRGGHFYKNYLPVIVRADLSFDESIVVELKFSRKIYFLLFCIVLLLSTAWFPVRKVNLSFTKLLFKIAEIFYCFVSYSCNRNLYSNITFV